MPQFTSQLYRTGRVTLPRMVQAALGAQPGDTIAFEVRGNAVILKRVAPLDAAFHLALSQTLEEWTTPEDESAFRKL